MCSSALSSCVFGEQDRGDLPGDQLPQVHPLKGRISRVKVAAEMHPSPVN